MSIAGNYLNGYSAGAPQALTNLWDGAAASGGPASWIQNNVLNAGPANFTGPVDAWRDPYGNANGFLQDYTSNPARALDRTLGDIGINVNGPWGSYVQQQLSQPGMQALAAAMTKNASPGQEAGFMQDYAKWLQGQSSPFSFNQHTAGQVLSGALSGQNGSQLASELAATDNDPQKQEQLIQQLLSAISAGTETHFGQQVEQDTLARAEQQFTDNAAPNQSFRSYLAQNGVLQQLFPGQQFNVPQLTDVQGYNVSANTKAYQDARMSNPVTNLQDSFIPGHQLSGDLAQAYSNARHNHPGVSWGPAALPWMAGAYASGLAQHPFNTLQRTAEDIVPGLPGLDHALGWLRGHL